MRNVERILIIEDEVEIAELEKDYLELSGFEVDLETNGRSGCSKALAGEYDLLILDLMLPDMDGFDICKAVRGKKNIPIIMVSAKKSDTFKYLRSIRIPEIFSQSMIIDKVE